VKKNKTYLLTEFSHFNLTYANYVGFFIFSVNFIIFYDTISVSTVVVNFPYSVCECDTNFK